MNRILIAASSALLLLAACGEPADTPTTPEETPPPPEPVGIIASDTLPDLAAAPTGIDFWTHPNVAFNSLIVVASADGLASYNVEDGVEVDRTRGAAYQGVAVSYIGFGPSAAGLAATFVAGEGAFEFFGIDNGSRLFISLDGGPAVDGAVNGFCMGRAAHIADPTLFVVQDGEMTIFNMAPAMDGEAAAIAVNGETGMDIPETISACTVDTAGVVYLLAETGEIYRVDSETAFAAPFAVSNANAPNSIVFLGSESESASFGPGQIAVLDSETGVIELFDGSDGHALGSARIDANADIDAVTEAVAMGGSAANLGGLYRDGAIALAVDGDAPGLRLMPVNGLTNALSVPPLPPANPRGRAPSEPESSDLIIDLEAPLPQ